MPKVFNFNNPSVVDQEQLDVISKLEHLADYYTDYFGKQYETAIRQRLNDCLTIFVDKTNIPLPHTNGEDAAEAYNKALMDRFFEDVYLHSADIQPEAFLNLCEKFLKLSSSDNLFSLNLDKMLHDVDLVYEIFNYNKIFSNKQDFFESLKTPENYDQLQHKIFVFYEKFRLQYYPIVESEFSQKQLPSFMSNQLYLFPDFNNDIYIRSNMELLRSILDEDLTNLPDKYYPLLLSLFHNNDFVDKQSVSSILKNDYAFSKLKSFQKYYKSMCAILEKVNIKFYESALEDNFNELARLEAEKHQSYSLPTENTSKHSLYKYMHDTVVAFVDTDENECVLPTGCEDVVATHEYIHVISNNQATHRCGFQLDTNDKLNLTLTMHDLNEVVTQFFALEINKQMEKDGFYLAKFEDFTTIYDDCVKLLKDFLVQYRDLFKTCYMENDLNLLIDLIGEENMHMLEDACHGLFNRHVSDAEYDYWDEINAGGQMIDVNNDQSNIRPLNNLKLVMDNIYLYIYEHKKTIS